MLPISLAYTAGFDKKKVRLLACEVLTARGFFSVFEGASVYIKKNKRGKKEGRGSSPMIAFKVTKKMRKNAPPDDYELTEEERNAIMEKNINNPKISETIKKRYQRKQIR